jgi:hypothetical protein
MPAHRKPPDLERLAAEQVAACLNQVPVGSSLSIDSSSELCDILELLIPEILRRRHPEWGAESIDGFFFSSAIKNDDSAAELVGTCILISDQAVTPFALDLRLSDPQAFASFRIRLGEPERGPLGISGPESGSPGARDMLLALNARRERVDWVYDVTL